jgi:hypothetical protein
MRGRFDRLFVGGQMPDPSSAGKYQYQYCTEYSVLPHQEGWYYAQYAYGTCTEYSVLPLCWAENAVAQHVVESRKSKVESRKRPFQGQDSNGPMLRCCPSAIAKIAVVEAMRFLAWIDAAIRRSHERVGRRRDHLLIHLYACAIPYIVFGDTEHIP